MNRTIILTATALAAAFIPSLQARPDEDRGGGGGGGGRSAHVQSAPQAQTHAQVMPRAQAPRIQQAPQVQARVQQTPQFQARVQQPLPRATAPVPALKPQVQQRAAIASAPALQQSRRQSPTIAFGGSAARNADPNATTARTFARSDARHSRPPGEVFRDWDRRQMHTWNNHRYRWYNNDWVIWDEGFAEPYYYDSTPYYDDSTAATPYPAAGDVVGAVQQELARRGYDPGEFDGVMGPETQNAVAQFQTDHRLPVTGRIDNSLLRALNL